MNWNKARKYKDLEPIDGYQYGYSDTYFAKLKAKAIKIAKTKNIYDFSKYDGKPKGRNNMGTYPNEIDLFGPIPESKLATVATITGKDWDTGTRKEAILETVDSEVSKSVVALDNKESLKRYKGNVANLTRSNKNQETSQDPDNTLSTPTTKQLGNSWD